MKEDVERLCQQFSKKHQLLEEERHFDMFEIRNGELYYKGVDKPLTGLKGRLRSVGYITNKIFGKNRLCGLGFDIPISKPTDQQAVMLNKTEEELPSTSDVVKTNDVELQEITENAVRSVEHLITQLRNHTQIETE